MAAPFPRLTRDLLLGPGRGCAGVSLHRVLYALTLLPLWITEDSERLPPLFPYRHRVPSTRDIIERGDSGVPCSLTASDIYLFI